MLRLTIMLSYTITQIKEFVFFVKHLNSNHFSMLYEVDIRRIIRKIILERGCEK